MPIDVNLSGVTWPGAIVTIMVALVVLAVLFLVNRHLDRSKLGALQQQTAKVGESITNGQKDYVVRKDLEQRFSSMDGRIDGIDRRFDGLDSRLDGVARDVGRLTKALLEDTATPPPRRKIQPRVDRD